MNQADISTEDKAFFDAVFKAKETLPKSGTVRIMHGEIRVYHSNGSWVDIKDFLSSFAELVAQHEREECINACNDVSYKYRCLYKGWEPYKGNEDGRANPHIDGMSDGADECAEAIRERNKS